MSNRQIVGTVGTYVACICSMCTTLPGLGHGTYTHLCQVRDLGWVAVRYLGDTSRPIHPPLPQLSPHVNTLPIGYRRTSRWFSGRLKRSKGRQYGFGHLAIPGKAATGQEQSNELRSSPARHMQAARACGVFASCPVSTPPPPGLSSLPGLNPRSAIKVLIRAGALPSVRLSPSLSLSTLMPCPLALSSSCLWSDSHQNFGLLPRY